MSESAASGAHTECRSCLNLRARNRELELQHDRGLGLQSELQQKVQQLAARNRELGLQLKLHKMAQTNASVTEAEGGRWCAPNLSCAPAPLNISRGVDPLSHPQAMITA